MSGFLLYVFLSYMLAECIIYIFSVQDVDTEYKESKYNQSTPEPASNVKSKIFKPGDIIQFIFSKNETSDYCFNRHPARRSISTYGFDEIDPEENIDYIVTTIEDHGSIPNHKGRYNVEKSMNNVDTFMYVFPKKEYDEMNGMFEHTKEVFWFVNLDKMTICQYEDAYPLCELDDIIVSGNYIDL